MPRFRRTRRCQPRITGIRINYSYQIPGTPNYAIPQGGIFVLYGVNMAPAGLPQQGFNPALNWNLEHFHS